MELDMLRQNTVVAAAATGKTALLGPILSCKPQLLADRDVLDRTALFHATHKGDFDSCLNLVRAGANIHDRDASGLPIISVAVARGCVKIVRDLLERAPHTVGLPSPLHEAVKAGNLEMYEILLAKGAWVDWRSPPDGKTPCQIARENCFDAIDYSRASLTAARKLFSAVPVNSAKIEPAGQLREIGVKTTRSRDRRLRLQSIQACCCNSSGTFAYRSANTVSFPLG